MHTADMAPPPAPRPNAGVRPRRALLVVLAAYLVLGVAYSFATRLRWGPDEPGHIAYIQSLALDHRFPNLGEEDLYRPGAAISHQVQHPPLYHFAAAVVYRLAMPLSEDRRVRVLRLFSVALGALALWLLWRLTGVLFPAADDRRSAVVAALALLPMFDYMTSVVNNDVLVIVLSAAAFLVTAKILAGDDRLPRHALAGLMAGLAIATKEVALALLPVVLVGLMLPRGESGPGFGRRLLGAGIALVIALAIPAPWWIRNQMLFDQPVVYAYVKPPFESLSAALVNPTLTLGILAVSAERSFLTMWAPYWAIKGIIPRAPYVLVAAAVFGGAVLGLLMLWVDHAGKRVTMARVQAQSMGLMLAFALLVAGGIIRYTLLVDYRAVEGGRYMLVTWPYLAMFGVTGWAYLAGSRRRIALSALSVLWLALDVTVLWAVGRTYARW